VPETTEAEDRSPGSAGTSALFILARRRTIFLIFDFLTVSLPTDLKEVVVVRVSISPLDLNPFCRHERALQKRPRSTAEAGFLGPDDLPVREVLDTTFALRMVPLLRQRATEKTSHSDGSRIGAKPNPLFEDLTRYRGVRFAWWCGIRTPSTQNGYQTEQAGGYNRQTILTHGSKP
jgi:hypothetical protein